MHASRGQAIASCIQLQSTFSKSACLTRPVLFWIAVHNKRSNEKFDIVVSGINNAWPCCAVQLSLYAHKTCLSAIMTTVYHKVSENVW